jgi:hypothetical protein
MRVPHWTRIKDLPMPLSQSALDEIQSELSLLDQLKAKIDARKAALEAVLTPFDFGQVTLPFMHGGGSNGSTHRETASVNSPELGFREAEKNPSANTGLRAAILEVLRQRGPKRSADVAATLKADGFTEGGSTPLPVRVYNDLWRMSQKGTVVNKDGVFSVG